jgi:8-oxo-dGTP pyrophosphatase MutT (NUDIX family)
MIRKAGLLVIRDNRILLCRKRHTTSLLILPGGRIEPGESAAECVARELREELGDVNALDMEYVGTYRERAAGEADKIVEIQLYRGELTGEPRPQAEIAGIVWFGQQDDQALLAPSIANRILPDLIARGILAWCLARG